MEFKHGLFGCFDNIGICIITYFVPCYTFGRVAEATGENCLLCGLVFLVPIANFIMHFITRGKLREMKGIEGSTVEDCLVVWFCGCCALVQEMQEVEEPTGATIRRT